MLKIFCIIINLFSMGKDCHNIDVVDSQLFKDSRICEVHEVGTMYSSDNSNDIENEEFVEYIKN
ncbi:MAG: hypothetical protein R3Y60_01075 [bacterium]